MFAFDLFCFVTWFIIVLWYLLKLVLLGYQLFEWNLFYVVNKYWVLQQPLSQVSSVPRLCSLIILGFIQHYIIPRQQTSSLSSGREEYCDRSLWDDLLAKILLRFSALFWSFELFRDGRDEFLFCWKLQEMSCNLLTSLDEPRIDSCKVYLKW